MITFLRKIFGSANERELKRLMPIVKKINELEPSMQALPDEKLSAKTLEFKERLAKGESLDDLLPEAYAVVREASKRKLGMRPFDVQLMGAIVLHQGKIAEMKTGEGKTLVATMPLYLNSLTGKSTHLVTVNDYLAKRDSEWNAPIYNFLGTEVACLQNYMEDEERKKVYAADILYGTNNEFGFDYLRDNMKFRLEDYVQRDLNYAIVDEVDSILIDEARTPLIISGPTDEESELYEKADRAVKNFKKGEDFEVDEKARSVQLTENGVDKIEPFFQIKNLYDPTNLEILHHVTQAMKAHALFKRDVDYMVRDGQVLIVDEFTGRVLPGRRYSDGLHQALEAKEGVKVEKESQTLASITLQNYFRLYKKLAGMTGTAMTEAEEFHKIYGLDVVSIPTNMAMIRDDKPDLIFLGKEGKYKEVVKDIQERHKKGQPVLIGTIAVETSELLSKILKMHGVPHEVLNAKHHEREAEIIKYAGHPGHVTIATNMAGRGTDIKLTPESKKAGGLYILGTERHESRRIDNQLRGRSGRQGDPGESRFYLSLDDDLIRIFGGIKEKMQRFGMKEDETIESKFISKKIESAQEKVEKHNFEIRKHLLEYDDVINQHRKVIYDYRRQILEQSDDTRGLITDLIIGFIQDAIAQYCPTRKLTHEQSEKVLHLVSQITAIRMQDFKDAGLSTENSDAFKKDLINFLLKNYEYYRAKFDQGQISAAEKWITLETVDKAWKQHMLNIDHLKEGIGYRGYAQKNPLYEYKREAFFMFKDMMQQIKWEIVYRIFHLNAAHFNQDELVERRKRELEQMMVGKNQQRPQAHNAERREKKNKKH
ncbi:TPA: preprotein translocase subunit SecA [Candidatus Dependentiae bacterium]|nr:MAG: Protein translocase subunit SecA [candidate division TM6 bacterium GW2011_GWF2_36_131]KKQ03796.1 MAG: Protein translocase subunit SecA [candidate division TM6 bacterium GW2011_GWE2_36_25]KKQ19942.1 MAG: Protein translocase subunit SecA [candidate division TM6 bacterium GW2011_GWA2_36_9]HBR70564.1 preprotein translocase subunit SecA [Candidatus Dependentiae bacterium]HCU00720.1 preprotein translocase subunit SecA [Candidatus Dependentiae bacterium]